MRRLRGPGGCPWDREQTIESIRRYTVEEVYEVLDAIDRSNWVDLREELGDLALQILFYAQIAEDEGHFAIADVLNDLNQKLVGAIRMSLETRLRWLRGMRLFCPKAR